MVLKLVGNDERVQTSDDDQIKDSQDKAKKIWCLGRELGLYAEEEEDIMTILGMKNVEKDAKRKEKNKNKNKRKNSYQMCP